LMALWQNITILVVIVVYKHKLVFAQKNILACAPAVNFARFTAKEIVASKWKRRAFLLDRFIAAMIAAGSTQTKRSAHRRTKKRALHGA
jgi:hypothetical protein